MVWEQSPGGMYLCLHYHGVCAIHAALLFEESAVHIHVADFRP